MGTVAGCRGIVCGGCCWLQVASCRVIVCGDCCWMQGYSVWGLLRCGAEEAVGRSSRKDWAEFYGCIK